MSFTRVLHCIKYTDGREIWESRLMEFLDAEIVGVKNFVCLWKPSNGQILGVTDDGVISFLFPSDGKPEQSLQVLYTAVTSGLARRLVEVRFVSG